MISGVAETIAATAACAREAAAAATAAASAASDAAASISGRRAAPCNTTSGGASGGERQGGAQSQRRQHHQQQQHQRQRTCHPKADLRRRESDGLDGEGGGHKQEQHPPTAETPQREEDNRDNQIEVSVVSAKHLRVVKMFPKWVARRQTWEADITDI